MLSMPPSSSLCPCTGSNYYLSMYLVDPLCSLSNLSGCDSRYGLLFLTHFLPHLRLIVDIIKLFPPHILPPPSWLIVVWFATYMWPVLALALLPAEVIIQPVLLLVHLWLTLVVFVTNMLAIGQIDAANSAAGSRGFGVDWAAIWRLTAVLGVVKVGRGLSVQLPSTACFPLLLFTNVPAPKVMRS